MFYNQDHLRVQRPVTSDGIQLVIDEETNQPLYKVSHLPITALKLLEDRNKTLPKNLKLKIEVIKGMTYQEPAPQQSETEQALLDKVAELEAKLAELSKQVVPPVETKKTVKNEEVKL